MVETIGNPISWTARVIGGVGHHLGGIAHALAGDPPERLPRVRRIGRADLFEALRLGLADFVALRSDVLGLCLFYPATGLALCWVAFSAAKLPLIFPLISGFALLGPLAAVGLYEMSRRREETGRASWADAFRVVAAPALGAIVVLGLFLVAGFALWLLVADGLYALTLGPAQPASAAAFLHDLFATPGGNLLIVLGVSTGFVFAATVLAASVVAFPLLLDRDVGLVVAVVTSVRVAARNPGAIAGWGAIVAGLLLLGSIPALLGLVVVIPVLGHATWHLYRRAVAAP